VTTEQIYDLVVIGGGSGGLVAAGGAALFGAKVALIEKHDLLGGDCLHFGCVPSKALIRTAHAAHDVHCAARFGTHVEGARSSVQAALGYVRDIVKVIGVHDDADRFRKMGIEVITGVSPTFLSPNTLAVGERVLRAKAFVIATGSRPAMPPVPGLGDVGAFDNETIFYKLEGEPRRMAVIGGGPIGVELGQSFARLGVHVTLLEVAERLLIKEDVQASQLIDATLRAEGIDVRLKTKITSASKKGETTVLTLEGPAGEPSVLEVEVVLAAAGRKPNVEGLSLEKAGVKLDKRGFVAVDGAMRTSAGHIYALGDVIGKFPFTHMAEAEAKVALRNALFPGTGSMSYDVVPWATFCDPEVGRVGPLEADLVAAGTPYRVFTFPYQDVDRALTDDKTAGFIKLLTKPSGHILGATIVGAGAGESIHEYVIAMKHGLRVQELSNTIHAYPTIALANRRAADQFMLAKLNESLGGKVLRWWVGRGRR
jgi:pyruvate/2-oxoglutarate dehydrogenase complex dihydrolipoamide dehydrogenase (E3) component